MSDRKETSTTTGPGLSRPRPGQSRSRPGLSRRGFLKGALAGAGAISFGSYEAVAQMVGGPSVRGWGVPAGLVRIDANENALGPSPRAVEAVLSLVTSINRYGQNPDLLGKLARRHGVPVVEWTDSPFAPVNDAWIAVGAGSSDLLFAIGHAYIREGTEVVESLPGFGFITRFAGVANADPVRVPLLEGMKPDLNGLSAAVTDRTAMVVVTSPGNPTGQLTPMSQLRPFVESIPERVLVLVDEAYIEFAENEADREGAASLIPDHPNVIVTRTFSKVFGMAGMRVGYAVARPEVIALIGRHRANTLTLLSTHAASAALDDTDHLRRSQELVSRGKRYFYEQLDAMGIEYAPSESSFVMMNMKTDVDELVRRMREEHNVLVGNARARWNIEGWIRVTAGLPEENEAFIAALKKVLVSS
ncbi:MAG: histidinol-phosphate transaminase [candidate division Zixibacteria bacterium]|nr:histidinol-phosphate transaminase [candidate division Zixibacteria bacterium]